MSDSVVKAFLVIGAVCVLVAAGAAVRFRGGNVDAIKETKWRLPVFAVGLALLGVSGIGALSHSGQPNVHDRVGQSGTPIASLSATSAPTSASASPSDAAAPTSGPGSVARQGPLTVRDSVAVDLDSSAPDWGAVKGTWNNIRDIEWDGPGKDTFSVNGGWDNVAVLGSAAPSDYVSCGTAPTGANPEAGGGFHVGERICVQTGRHLVLLTVKAVNASVNGSPATLVLDAIVWND